tara:strand:+ start:5693 stop:6874 length:1182 start_codon:yes stop_codon:yes gene_type:complete
MDMNTNKINVLKPKYRTDEILDSIKDCLNIGWTGMGYKTIEFEKAWKEYTGLPNAHFINSGTSGLHLALNLFKKKYGWEDGDEVITTALTFISTNHSILYENLTPIFADVDETLCLDPKSIEQRITDKTRAIMFVGVGGNAGKLNEVADICKKYNLKLILDAAHMAGTKIKKVYHGVAMASEHVGQEADCTVFSFQAVKNLPTADSGMICFKDSKDDEKVRRLSWLGINKDTYSRSNKGSYKWRYNVEDVGFKYHGNSVMASIGLVQLQYLDADNNIRNEIVNKYKSLLKDVDIIHKSNYTETSSCHLFQIKIPSHLRDDLINKLYDNNIYPGVHYIDNTIYDMYKYAYGTCPITHKLSEELITLPIHLDMTLLDQIKIIDIINKFIKDEKNK